MMDTPPFATASSRILIVDDEAPSRDLCFDILQEGGYTVLETARNGEEALALLSQRPFQLVLTDINMPRMTGLELLKRGKPLHPDVDFILMTAYGFLQTALEALRSGAYDYITKPFSGDVLLATVRRCLEKRRLAQDLLAAQEKLVKNEKLAALGSMSGWLAHRMRNPLNVILMCAQYLKTKLPEPDENREVVMAIEDKVNNLEKMTRDFIDFSRSHQPSLQPEDLHALMERVLEHMASRFRIQKVAVEKTFDTEIPMLLLDREQLEEVFGNLFDNALEAMGGLGTIRLLTQRTSLGVAIDVANSGTPMPADLLGRVFEPFFTTKERGTGLGLAIVQRVLESHGGRVTVTANPETTFRLWLPLPADEKDEGETAA